MSPCFVLFCFPARNPAPKNSARQRGRADGHLLNEHRADITRIQENVQWSNGESVAGLPPPPPEDRLEMPGWKCLEAKSSFAHPSRITSTPCGSPGLHGPSCSGFTQSVCLSLKAVPHGSPATSISRTHLCLGPDA